MYLIIVTKCIYVVCAVEWSINEKWKFLITFEVRWQTISKLEHSISKTFISKARLKLAKSEANTKQHLEAELLLFENLWHSYLHYHLEIIGYFPNDKLKDKCICILETLRLIRLIMMKMKMKSRSHSYYGIETDTNVVNIKRVSLSRSWYVLSNN